jgi:hypothetical protein
VQRISIRIAAVLAFLVTGACSQERTITGEVFFVKGVGVSQKLGLVTIYAYDLREAQNHVKRKQFESQKHIVALKDFEKQLELLWKMPGSGGECWSLK